MKVCLLSKGNYLTDNFVGKIVNVLDGNILFDGMLVEGRELNGDGGEDFKPTELFYFKKSWYDIVEEES